MNNKRNALKAFFEESLSYRNFQDLENLMQDSTSLEHVPLWPLYFSLREGTSDQLVEALPLLNKKQRQYLRDLETWHKDQMDVKKFDHWCLHIFRTQDLKVIEDFVTAKDFLLYLKGRFTISLFDQEELSYPEHDNFFTTDDDQFIIEYDEKFQLADEVKSLIKHFYAHYGVELARDIILSLIPESFILLQEEIYLRKKERLREFGHVDYFEALELKSVFTQQSLNKFVTSKFKTKYNLPVQDEEKNLGHYNKVVIPFHNKFGSLFDELEKIENEKQHQFLLYNFSCLINAQLVLSDSFRNEKVDFNELGDSCRQRVNLGLNYIQNVFSSEVNNKSIFEYFNFYDLYRIGNSLLSLVRKDMKHHLEELKKEMSLVFLGDHWNIFIEDVFENNFKVKQNGKAIVVEDYLSYQELLIRKNILISSIPLIRQFFLTITEIRGNGVELDALNLKIDEVDFESLLLTQFISSTMNLSKIGYSVPVNEFWKFLDQIYFSAQLVEKKKEFFKKFSLDLINNFEIWFTEVLAENFDYLKNEKYLEVDTKFISGVLLKS